PPGPHGIQELVLADDVLAVPHQMEQQVEDLRPDGDRLSAARELPSVRVDHVVLERVPHVALSSPPIAAHRHGRQAIDSTVIIAEARAGCRAGIASGNCRSSGAFSWIVLLFCLAVLDGNPSEIQSRLKAATRLSGRRSGILCRVEYETT